MSEQITKISNNVSEKMSQFCIEKNELAIFHIEKKNKSVGYTIRCTEKL